MLDNNTENESREKIIIYKTNNCSLHNNYIYCDDIQLNFLNDKNIIDKNIIDKNNKIKTQIEKYTEKENILCYTY